jgi:hypothetical protein
MIPLRDIKPFPCLTPGSTTVVVEAGGGEELPGGESASSVEMRTTETHVQWRVAPGAWTNLIALSEIKGDTGPSVELQATETHIQWRVAGGEWANLIALSAITGPAGSGGGAAINPSVAYVRTNGDDETAEIGNPAKPYQTFGRALSAVEAIPLNFASFDFGVGSFTGIVPPNVINLNRTWFFRGAGKAMTTLGLASQGTSGSNGSDGDSPGANGSAGSDGDDLTVLLAIESDMSMTIYIALSGGAGGNGGNGASGGEGFSNGGNGASPGNGGDVTGILAFNSLAASISVNGGAIGSAGNGGPGGLEGGDMGSIGSTSGINAGFDNLTLNPIACVLTDSRSVTSTAAGNYVNGTFHS